MKNCLKSTTQHAKVMLASCGLTLLGSALVAAQGLRISDAKFGPDQKLHIAFTADPNSYYILYRGNVVTNIFSTTDAALAPASKLGELTDRLPRSTAEAAFFRIRQVPMGQPLDLDGDGIDDVYELQRRNLLDH
jgi:hypothetical protein